MSSSRPSLKIYAGSFSDVPALYLTEGGSFFTPPSGRSGHFIVFQLINLEPFGFDSAPVRPRTPFPQATAVSCVFVQRDYPRCTTSWLLNGKRLLFLIHTALRTFLQPSSLFSVTVFCFTDDIIIMCDIVLCAIKHPYVDLSTHSNVPSMKADSRGRQV